MIFSRESCRSLLATLASCSSSLSSDSEVAGTLDHCFLESRASPTFSPSLTASASCWSNFKRAK
jgi:hypothetical protein